MTKYTQDQIYTMCLGVGFPKDAAVTASAIAMAESGGDTDATNDKSGAMGVWQFLPMHVGPGKLLPSVAAARNLALSTNAAFNLSKRGTSFTPWEAYTNGSYQQFMPGANNPPPVMGTDYPPGATVSDDPALNGGGSGLDWKSAATTASFLLIGFLLITVGLIGIVNQASGGAVATAAKVAAVA